MAELLAPGVYVQETSFRAKPIEGVSTSTAAFVGLTRRGPTTETPELLTSVGDFERTYGATAALDLGGPEPFANYIAHAVRAFFDNGGRRLYVSRVYEPRIGRTGVAESEYIVGTATAATNARFIARFPGAYGNTSIQLAQVASPAAWPSMDRAFEGTVVRTGAEGAAVAAKVVGGRAPFDVEHESVLQLQVAGANAGTFNVTFRGSNVEAAGTTDLADPVPLTAADHVLTVKVGDSTHVIELPEEDTSREQVLSLINANLRGAYARLEGDRLVIGTDRRGTSAKVAVAKSEVLGFAAANTDGSSTGSEASNVADISAVTAEEVRTLLLAATATALQVSVDPTSRALIIQTTEASAAATITIGTPTSPTKSASGALGLGTPTPGKDGATIEHYAKRGTQWLNSSGTALAPGSTPTGGIQFLSLTVTVIDADNLQQAYDNVAFGPEHPRYIGALLPKTPTRGQDRIENGFAFVTNGTLSALEVRTALLGNSAGNAIALTGGNDGAPPIADRFGDGLTLLEPLEDISTLAAPGSSALTDEHAAIREKLLEYVERPRAYCTAVLDTPPNQTVGGMRTDRSGFDSKYAALYGPWLYVSNPDQRPGDERIPREIKLPASGFVCGIFARNDFQRGVYKAPANEPVRGVVRLESNITFGDQEVLNPEGINVVRFFPGRGFRLWGARLASSDPEWNYVNLRRYFNFIEASIDRSTQWAVFEPNGDILWRRIRDSVTTFLQNEWREGALLGATAEQAFFVRCDRSTMTQSDLDNGRLICEIGIAVVRPAEFVVFRIGQSTADARS